ncbi:MAG: hypothetical protein U0167_04115 [bacterium]
MTAPCLARPSILLSALLAFGGSTLLAPPTAHAVKTILSANFDSEPIDQPIATSGPAFGEPVSVTSTITAFVRSYPYPTPSLKINDDDLLDAGFVRFQFLTPDTVVTHGIVTISATLWFTAYEEYGIRVRERGSRSQKFCDLVFGSTGSIRYIDQNTPNLAPTPLGSYVVGRPEALVMTFNMDDGIYSVTFDGIPLLVNETHGVPDPHGIGAVLFGMEADDDISGEFNLDDLLVTVETPTATSPVSWAKTKASYR